VRRRSHVTMAALSSTTVGFADGCEHKKKSQTPTFRRGCRAPDRAVDRAHYLHRMEPPEEYWHVIVSRKQLSGAKARLRDDAVAVDKTRKWIEDRILEPRRHGSAIAVAGHTMEWDEIDRVRITVSEQPSDYLISQIKAEDRASSVAVLGGPGYRWRAAARGADATDDLIVGPPGASVESGPAPVRVDSRRVMVVYGRDGEARRAMFDFLRALGLEPREWRKLVADTERRLPTSGRYSSERSRMRQR
jgi:hypothetical protein